MKFFAVLLLTIGLPLTASGVRLGPKRTMCGITFRAPRSWTVEKFTPAHDDDDIRCAIGLKPRGWNENKSDNAIDLGPYAVTMLVTTDNFQDAARRAQFSRAGDMRKTDEPPRPDDPPPYPPLSYKDDDWLTSGRMGFLHGAERIEGPSWTGLIGSIMRGYSHPQGGNAGIGDVIVASLTSRGAPFISVVIGSSGVSDDAARAVVRTIQIRRR
jgi:hypothetical protein